MSQDFSCILFAICHKNVVNDKQAFLTFFHTKSVDTLTMGLDH